VAAAVAARTGLEVSVVRLAFVALTPLTGGFVTAVYLLAWLIMPAVGSDRGIGHKAAADRRGIALAAGAASLLIVLLILAELIGAAWFGSVGWLLVIDLVCLVLIWRNGDAHEQAAIRRLVEPLFPLEGAPRRRATVLRVAVAAVLLIAGVVILASAHENIKMLRPLAGLALVIASIAIILGPWWLGIARNLVDERQARIRAEERADMASRVHDSVLQTLAMIQRRADQPQQVIQLARAQERELRAWLFDGQAPGSLGGEETTLAAGVRLIQQEVEAQHGISVEAVTVRGWPRRAWLRSTPRSGRARTSSRCSPRSSPRPCRCSCATAGAGSTRPRCPATARGWPSPCTPGCHAGAAPRPCAVPRARAPRSL
jgi:hypothetical protein